jgi:hypothetical protein
MYVAAAITVKDIGNSSPDPEQTLRYFLTHGWLPGEPGSLERRWAEYQESIQIGPFVRVQDIRAEIDRFDATVMARFKNCLDDLHKLNGHQFSAFIGAVLKDQGCDVKLGPKTRDGGISWLFLRPRISAKSRRWLNAKGIELIGKSGSIFFARFSTSFGRKRKHLLA